MYKADPEQAAAYASGYSRGIAYRTMGAANSERDVIMTMITKSTDPQ